MKQEDQNPPKKSGRWLKPVLFFSLAANLLIVGLVAGAFLSPDGPRKKGGDENRAVRGIIGAPFFQALPEKERRNMVREVMGNREKFQERRQVLVSRFENFLAALRSEEFDREEVGRLLGEQRQAAVRRQELGEVLLLDRISEMTTEERATYADELEKRLKWLNRR